MNAEKLPDELQTFWDNDVTPLAEEQTRSVTAIREAESTAQSVRAKRDRAKGKIRLKVIDAMRVARREGRKFNEFIEALRAESIEDIIIDDNWVIYCEKLNPSEKAVSENTLRTWWTEANKKKK